VGEEAVDVSPEGADPVFSAVDPDVVGTSRASDTIGDLPANSTRLR
jgi:hypothetical protein